MPRIARNSIETPFLHVMVQGVNKEYIFNNNKYIEMYLKLIEKNKIENDVTILAYCVMNNHAHFLMYIENMEKFSKFMHKINFMFAEMYNKKENRCGVLFRNRYRSEPIYDRKYLINCIKYIHENPVKAGMVTDASNYKYSSYNNYINNVGECQSPIIKGIFGEKCDFKKVFAKAHDIGFMDDEISQEEKNMYIKGAIEELLEINSIKLVDALTNRRLLKLIIRDLKEKYGFSYIEIREFFRDIKNQNGKFKNNKKIKKPGFFGVSQKTKKKGYKFID